MAAKGKLCSVFQKMISHFLWDLFLSKKEFSSIVCGGCSDLAASGLVGGAAPTDIGHLPSHSLPPTEVRGKSPTSTAPTDIEHLPSFPVTKVSLQLVFNSSSNLHGSGLLLPTPSNWGESPGEYAVCYCYPTGWQKLCGGTGGPRQKVWTRTKILSPNIRYFVAN